MFKMGTVLLFPFSFVDFFVFPFCHDVLLESFEPRFVLASHVVLSSCEDFFAVLSFLCVWLGYAMRRLLVVVSRSRS